MVNVTREEALEIFKYEYDTFEKFYLIIPIISGGQRLGTLVATRYCLVFLQRCNFGKLRRPVIGLEILRRKRLMGTGRGRAQGGDYSPNGHRHPFSYSEVEAVRRDFQRIERLRKV